jgi:hypothetical protein
MLIELGGSEVYLQDKGVCDSKRPWPAIKISIETLFSKSPLNCIKVSWSRIYRLVTEPYGELQLTHEPANILYGATKEEKPRFLSLFV